MRSPHRLFYIILFLILFCYSGALLLDFALDDIFLIKKNRYLATDWKRLLTSDLWAGDETANESSFFRPLFLFSLIVDWSLGKLNPSVFHAQSLLWHMVCTYFVYCLVVRIANKQSALVSMLVFGLHPIQSEVVLWISARNDSMATAFALGALILFLRDRLRWYDWSLACLLLFCALTSKETTVFFPLIVYLFAERERSKKLVISGGVVGFALLVRSVFSIQVQVPDAAHWSLFWEKIGVSILKQFSLFFFPWPLSPVRPLAWEDLTGEAPISALCFLILIFWLCKQKWGRNGVVFSVLTYIPVFGAIVSNGVYGDRYLYLPMVGIAIGVGVCIQFRYWMLSFVVLWSATLWVRVPNWSSDETLWTSIYEGAPSPYSAASLAHIKYNNGQYRDAAELYQESFSDPVPYLAGCDTYTASVLKVKGPHVALDAGLWALERGCPLSGKLAGLLAVCLAGTQDWEIARYILQQAPHDPSKRDKIVWAALAVREGKWTEYMEYKENWSASTSFAEQVQILLQTGDGDIILKALPMR